MSRSIAFPIGPEVAGPDADDLIAWASRRYFWSLVYAGLLSIVVGGCVALFAGISAWWIVAVVWAAAGGSVWVVTRRLTIGRAERRFLAAAAGPREVLGVVVACRKHGASAEAVAISDQTLDLLADSIDQIRAERDFARLIRILTTTAGSGEAS